MSQSTTAADALVLPGKRKPYIMAHRGNRVACPENTLAAFRRAFDDGADILETDLHLTTDGIFVCIHDSTLDRTTDGHGAVAEMTLAEIKLHSASYGQPEFQAEKVPALAELTAILPNDVALALELKTDRFLEANICQQLAEELEQANVRQRTVVLSFSLARIRAVQAVAPDIPIGWITLFRAWPLSGVQMIGPLWPMLVINPLYTWIAHRARQLVAPLDPLPDRRLWYYRLLACDAVLTDNPASTVRTLRSARRI